MGSAFQLGVAALLSQSDGSILGVPTSPFGRPESADPTFVDPSDAGSTDIVSTEVEATDVATDIPTAETGELGETVAETTNPTDWVEAPTLEEGESPRPLAPPPVFKAGRMRRTSMWQARVDQVVEQPDSTTDQPVDVETEVAAPAGDEPATSVGMFDAGLTEAIASVVAPLDTPTAADEAPTAHATSDLEMDRPVQEVPWAPLPRRDDPPIASVEPTPEPEPAPALPPQPGGELNEFGLPKRAPRKASPTQELVGDKLVTTPRRPAEEIRSILSSYRSGLTSGRDGNEAPNESPSNEQPAPQRNPNERGNDEPTQF
jgi:hypothetical protein